MIVAFIIVLLQLVLSTKSLASLQIARRCPDLCTCTGTSAKCLDITDKNLAAVLKQLPNDLTKLDLSYNRLTRLKKDVLRYFDKLEILSLAENAIERLDNDCFNGLHNLKELGLQNNGKHFAIQGEVFHNTPLLKKLRLEGNPGIESLRFLKTLNHLREISVDIWNTCERCSYIRFPKNELCESPRSCLDQEKSPFRKLYCACASCVRLRAKMNCTDEPSVAPRILGDKTAVRVVLWVISTIALLSNIALIVTRFYTHARRQRPLSIFVVGLALSNLFVTSSVIILLVADSHRDNSGALGQGSWAQSVCSPVYFLKHFGIYSLVMILTFIILERFTKLGFKLCFTPERTPELSYRRSAVYICEAWVLSFLLIIQPWTRVTTWHSFCMASYEMAFSQAMYIFCGVLVLGVCLAIIVLVGLLFYRRVFTLKSGTRHTETRMDIRLILAGILTFVFVGIPYVATSIAHMSGQESGTEAVTILLSIACLLYPLILINYSPNAICLSDTLSTKNMECTCGKCNVEQFYPTKYSIDSLSPPKSTDTATEYHEDSDNRRHFTKVSSAEHMSADSLLDLDTWASHSTKTKSWIVSCDYDDLKKLKTQSWTRKEDNSFHEVTSKPRALTWSDKYGGKSASTSGVNDVSSVTSSCSERASSSSGRVRSSSERERSCSDNAPLMHSVVIKGQEEATKAHEVATTKHEKLSTNHDTESEKTSDRKRGSKRLSSFKGFIQRALSPRRQRSKSLPGKPEEHVQKFECSQSAPLTVITAVDKTGKINSNATSTAEVAPESSEPSSSCQHRKNGEQTYMERLASFFILAPAKSPKHLRKSTSSPKKAKPVGVVSPIPSQKSSVAERLAKSFPIGRKSPCYEPASPGRTITLEAGDILTELPVMRRQKLRNKPRDPMARVSNGSTCSAGSTTTRYSMEWDPIGSVEGYDEHEVLPPYPPNKIRNGHLPSKVPRPLSEVPPPEQSKVTERTSLYSLDWDPTSVQLRNSYVSRDSLGSLGDRIDDAGHMYDIEDCKESKGKTVWV